MLNSYVQIQREREREREQINNYRQEIKAGSGQFVSYQNLIFDLCWVHQQKLLQCHETNNQNLDYLKEQWLTWQLGQANLVWLAKNIEEAIDRLKTELSIFNLYGTLTTENHTVEELKKLLETINKTFSNGKTFERHLNFQLLDNSAEQSKRKTKNFINSTQIERNFAWKTESIEWEQIIKQLEKELKNLQFDRQGYYPSPEESQNDLEIADDLLLNKNTLITQQNKEIKNKKGKITLLERKIERLERKNKELQNQLNNRPASQPNKQSKGWKSHLWQTTKNLGLASLIYGGGYYYGSNSNAQPGNQLQLNCQTNPTQLYTFQGQSISFNSTHSWIENSLSQDFPTTINRSPTTFDITGNINDTAINFVSNNSSDYDEIVKERDAWKEKYEQAELKPSGLPSNWKSELTKIKDLETKLSETQKRPTEEQLRKAVSDEKSKHQHLVDPAVYRVDWIDPLNLESEAKSKGMVSQKDYDQRPNITITEYNNLVDSQIPADLPNDWKEQLIKKQDLEKKVSELEKRPTQENYNKLKNNQRPIDLPPNWKSELASIPKLKKKIKKQKAQINNLKSRPNITLEEFAKYKSPEQVAKIEQAIRKEFEGYINPADQTKIIIIAKQVGYQFKQVDIDKAIDEKDKEWKEKGLVNPHNQTETDQAGLIKKSEYEQIKQERDNRPNITLDDYDKLKNNQKPPGLPENWKSELTKIPSLEKQIKDLQLRPNISQNQWDTVQDDLEQTEQAKRALEIAYQKKVGEVEQLNKINQDNSTFTKDLIVWIDNSQPQTAGQIQTDLMVLREKHSPLGSENNNWQSLLITNLGTLLISQWKNWVDSKKFQQERTKLQRQINQAQQAQQQVESERDTVHRERDAALNAQRKAEKEVNEQKIRLTQKENELNQANQKVSEYQAKLTQQEQKIVQQLNNSLKLGLNNPSLEQVIGKIQELINKPPQTIYEEFSNDELERKLNQTYQTIARLEKELKEQTPFEEDLNTIKELELQSLEELFGKGDNLWQQKIQQAVSYQQIVSARRTFIQEKLKKNQTIQVIEQPKREIVQLDKEKAILISLLVVSLVGIGELLVKLRGKKER